MDKFSSRVMGMVWVWVQFEGKCWALLPTHLCWLIDVFVMVELRGCLHHGP